MNITGIYINVPIADLAKSRHFFQAIGFSIYEKYSGDSHLCLELAPNIRVMLTEKAQFEAMLGKPAANRESSEALLSLTCESPELVKSIAESAFAQGAREIDEFEENEFMYSWGFEDLDGHVWDLHCFKNE